MRLTLPTLLAVLLAACGGGGSSPTGPAANATPSPNPTPTPPAPAPTPTPPSGPMILRMASISGANGHSASGTARIVRDGTSLTLQLGNDFRIDSGNNDVCLTRNRMRCEAGDLNLGNMRSVTGAQNYEMPNDGAQYPHVMLWCRPFQVPIGIGDLR